MFRLRRFRKVAIGLAIVSAGQLWLGGCVTDAQFRDFTQTTVIRVFWQAVGTAIQATIVDRFGANGGA
ncbi:MAG: hypothetical protein HZB38_09290 [Planctomycetes bacterium]|nr:hypothetical protein [Planctomycetota bacterium]